VPEVVEKREERAQSRWESARIGGKKRRKGTIKVGKCPNWWRKEEKGHNQDRKVPKVAEKRGERAQSR